ncbi:MAG: hypothetical protein DMG06_17250 [Acidobacteria bacterium]|nr:MAG: hypothetical protein DMG06_17250 [Acidobacteriota bacterium]
MFHKSFAGKGGDSKTDTFLADPRIFSRLQGGLRGGCAQRNKNKILVSIHITGYYTPTLQKNSVAKDTAFVSEGQARPFLRSTGQGNQRVCLRRRWRKVGEMSKGDRP